MLPYENIPVGKVHVDVIQLLQQNPNLRTDTQSIVFLKNNPCGFAASTIIILVNAYYLHSINPQLICLPLFCQNTANFKYHDTSLNNSFFLYFKYNHNLGDISNYNLYFVDVPIVPGADIVHKIPPMLYSPNDALINYFRSNFTLRIGSDVVQYINTIKSTSPLVGIHMRSLGQKWAHHPEYCSLTMSQRIKALKDTIHQDTVYVATDVHQYIDTAKQVFDTVHYLSDISRIHNEEDSIPQLKEVGFKLGSDILRECLALSLCDVIYVSSSNIPFLVSILNPSCKMIEY
jgi:hypothetical protein